jgi:hypothetical protein
MYADLGRAKEGILADAQHSFDEAQDRKRQV